MVWGEEAASFCTSLFGNGRSFFNDFFHALLELNEPKNGRPLKCRRRSKVTRSLGGCQLRSRWVIVSSDDTI